jgi:hypothetical protein
MTQNIIKHLKMLAGVYSFRKKKFIELFHAIKSFDYRGIKPESLGFDLGLRPSQSFFVSSNSNFGFGCKL